MIHPACGPFLFDTSAESRLERPGGAAFTRWAREYMRVHEIHVSAATVVERIRGYGLLWSRGDAVKRKHVESMRSAYLSRAVRVISLDAATAVVSGEIMALLPEAPSPPRRSHRLAESRQERLSRWRFDAMIAATALVAALPLIHDNPDDFEAIRAVVDRFPERFPTLGPLQLIRYTQLI